MSTLIAALAQINPTVGALHANAELVIQNIIRAADQQAGLVIFPELCLSGYPPEDLVLKPQFLDDIETQLDRIATAMPPDITAIVGAPIQRQGRIHNAAIVLQQGHQQRCYLKMALPNYGTFDEKRIFAEGTSAMAVEAGGHRFVLHICEDSWLPDGKACQLARQLGADALVNLSASPYHVGKRAIREQALRQTAHRLNLPIFYCNLVGGQDELVFDGASMVLGCDGRVIRQASQFSQDLLLVRWSEVIASHTILDPPARLTDEPEAEIHAALCLGLRDYVEKNRFSQVLVAISGGIDSALVACLAVDALGPGRVVGVTMPSEFTSWQTRDDARELAKRLGIEFHDIPITSIYNTSLEKLSSLWPGRTMDSTEENLQARIRGNLVMAMANKFNWLVLTTGNKSEFATGYCTLYGDMAGGLAVIKDLYKTQVYKLSRWCNEQNPESPPIPVSIIERAPSAELRPNQKDQDFLPPYETLDPILTYYIEQDRSIDRIVAAGFDPAVVARVIRLVDASEYKRRQSPPGIKITAKSFGRDRRLPITSQYHDQQPRFQLV
ncbi:MAG: NAD+ synthase [Phycisphaerales bacterium]|nr:NAD+ synthase [Phycisphaerales bacterium]